jgi:hypothetical protein
MYKLTRSGLVKLSKTIVTMQLITQVLLSLLLKIFLNVIFNTMFCTLFLCLKTIKFHPVEFFGVKFLIKETSHVLNNFLHGFLHTKLTGYGARCGELIY